jgi:hypothetical protein
MCLQQQPRVANLNTRRLVSMEKKYRKWDEHSASKAFARMLRHLRRLRRLARDYSEIA